MLKTAVVGLAGILTLAMSGPSASIQDFPWPAAPDPRLVETAPPTHWDPPGAFLIAFGSPAEIDAYCRRGAQVPAGYIVLACTASDRRQVAMPNPCLYQHEYYAKLMCHEQAHLDRPGISAWRH